MERQWRRFGEWALVVVLGALGELQFWLGQAAHARLVAGGVPSALLLAATAGALAWRRRFPAVAVSVATAGFLAAGLFVLSRVGNGGPIAFFVAVLIAYYSVGAWGRGAVALAAAAAGLGAMVALDLARGVFDLNGSPQPVAWVLFVVAWGIGREIGRRRGDVRVLQIQARRLEREREERARLAVDEERARIARELHDIVAHSVSVMVVQAQAGPRLLDDPDRVRCTFASIDRAGREALVELRRMLGLLRDAEEKPDTGPQPGLASLDGLVDQVRAAGLSVDVVTQGEQRPLPVGVDLAAYRIVQEALTNTLKHADGEYARVLLHYERFALSIEVADNGRSGPAAADSPGHGLIGMRERVGLYGGELVAGPSERGGFAVSARLPLHGIDE